MRISRRNLILPPSTALGILQNRVVKKFDILFSKIQQSVTLICSLEIESLIL